MAESTTIRWEQDEDGIVVLTLDDPNQSANTMNARLRGLDGRHGRPPRGREGRRSPASSSPRPRRRSSPAATSTTCKAAGKDDAPRARRDGARGQGASCAAWRRSASRCGGDQRRGPRRRPGDRAWPATTASPSTTRRSQIGFPEVQLGLLPGAGGVVRTVRMLGIADALMQLLMQGQRLRPAKAHGDRASSTRSWPRRRSSSRPPRRGSSSAPPESRSRSRGT